MLHFIENLKNMHLIFRLIDGYDVSVLQCLCVSVSLIITKSYFSACTVFSAFKTYFSALYRHRLSRFMPDIIVHYCTTDPLLALCCVVVNILKVRI